MVQMPTKWKVRVEFIAGDAIEFYVHDNFVNNVLQTVAKLSFDYEPGAVIVTEADTRKRIRT